MDVYLTRNDSKMSEEQCFLVLSGNLMICQIPIYNENLEDSDRIAAVTIDCLGRFDFSDKVCQPECDFFDFIMDDDSDHIAIFRSHQNDQTICRIPLNDEPWKAEAVAYCIMHGLEKAYLQEVTDTPRI